VGLETGEATCARCVEINRSEEDQRPSRPTRPTVSGSDDIASVVTPPTGWPLAERDWHTRARIRIVREITVNSTAFCAPRTYRVGEELTMVQDGLAGGQVDRGTWRMSIDDRALP
jgi:hypothetical protein